MKRYVRAIIPKATETQVVDLLFDGVPSYLKAYLSEIRP